MTTFLEDQLYISDKAENLICPCGKTHIISSTDEDHIYNIDQDPVSPMCTLVLPREVQKENLGMLESMDAIINLMSTEDNTATEGANKTLSTNNNKTGNETATDPTVEKGSNKTSLPMYQYTTSANKDLICTHEAESCSDNIKLTETRTLPQ